MITTQPIPDIGGLLDHLRGSDPGRPLLTFYRGRTPGGRLTCGQLLSYVDCAAAYLQELGVKRGDRVAVLSPNRLEVPVLFLGIMRLGATIVPLNPTAPASDWSFILGHSGALGLFAAQDLLPQAQGPALSFRLPIDDLLSRTATSTTPTGVPTGTGEDMAVVLYTSGTTGDPKGVALCQRNILANPWSMAPSLGLGGVTQFAVLPLYHAHAFGIGLMSALSTSGRLVFAEKLDPLAWSEVIRTEQVVVTSVVPSLLPLLLQARVRADKVPTLRGILVSSAPLSQELARTFLDQTGIPLVQGWGLSEYTNFACCQSLSEGPDELRRQLLAWDAPSIGGPLPGTEVAILDREGNRLPPGERGELCIRGHSRMLSYYRNPETTARTIIDGWLHSGDEGLYRMEGDRPLFFITGRIKEIIIRGGEKYSPLAVERRLVGSLPELDGRMVVLGFAHQLLGEEVGAYIEAGAWQPALAERLMTALGELPVDYRPKVVLIGEAPIPRTHTGKIQRRKLVPLYESYKDCKGPARIIQPQ